MLQVVASVIANERQHGHRVVPQGTHFTLGGGGLAGCQEGTNKGGMVPVMCLGDQRDSVGASSAKENGRDRYTFAVVEFGGHHRALLNGYAVAGVWVAGQLAGIGGPVVA